MHRGILNDQQVREHSLKLKKLSENNNEILFALIRMERL